MRRRSEWPKSNSEQSKQQCETIPFVVISGKTEGSSDKPASFLPSEKIKILKWCFSSLRGTAKEVVQETKQLLNYNHTRAFLGNSEKQKHHQEINGEILFAKGIVQLAKPNGCTPECISNFQLPEIGWLQDLYMQTDTPIIACGGE